MATTSLTIHVCKALWDREGFGLKVCHPLLIILFDIHKLDRLPLEQAEEKEYHRPLHLQYYSVTFPVFHPIYYYSCGGGLGMRLHTITYISRISHEVAWVAVPCNLSKLHGRRYFNSLSHVSPIFHRFHMCIINTYKYISFIYSHTQKCCRYCNSENRTNKRGRHHLLLLHSRHMTRQTELLEDTTTLCCSIAAYFGGKFLLQGWPGKHWMSRMSEWRHEGKTGRTLLKGDRNQVTPYSQDNSESLPKLIPRVSHTELSLSLRLLCYLQWASKG